MIKNILFDWSGTLADDLGPVLKATNAIFRHYKRKELTLDEFRLHFRLPYSEFYDDFIPEADAETLETLYERHFANLHDEVTLLPGANDLLKFFRKTNRRTFLLSTIKHDHFEAQATRLGVRDAFEHPYTAVLDKRERIQSILTERCLDPAETIFVGDMVHDIETAQSAGVTSVVVLTGFDPIEKLAPARPDMIIARLSVLQNLLSHE